MALTLANLKLYIGQVLGTADTNLPPSGGSDDTRKMLIINQAGRSLFNAWPWKFRERPPKKLNFAAPISLTGATWTESSKTITKTGAFASYTFAPGDELVITGGTGATEGTYPIASKTDSNDIVLVDSIGSSADGQTDIEGSISFPYAALPSDFGEMLHVRADGVTVDFDLVTFEQLAEFRDNAILPVGFMYYGAITHPAQAAQTTAFGIPRLEIYPAPTSAQVGALTLWYRAGWRELTSDTQYAAIPDFVETLLIEFIRAHAEGHMNAHSEENGLAVLSMTDRLDEIIGGSIFRMATHKDMLTQPHYGVMTGGLIGSMTSSMPSVVRTQDHHDVATPFII